MMGEYAGHLVSFAVDLWILFEELRKRQNTESKICEHHIIHSYVRTVEYTVHMQYGLDKLEIFVVLTV